MNESNSSTPDLLETAKADKAGLALLLQRSQQNFKADQVVLDHNKRFRENQHRILEARMKNFGAEGAGTPQAGQGDDVGNILIDSPTTENHYHQTPPAPPAPATAPASSWLTKAAIAAALLAGGGGAGYVVNNFVNKPAQVAPYNPLKYNLELVPNKKSP